VVRPVALGRTDAEIAAEPYISLCTIRTRLSGVAEADAGTAWRSRPGVAERTGETLTMTAVRPHGVTPRLSRPSG
jgi:hypothetical protein